MPSGKKHTIKHKGKKKDAVDRIKDKRKTSSIDQKVKMGEEDGENKKRQQLNSHNDKKGDKQRKDQRNKMKLSVKGSDKSNADSQPRSVMSVVQ